MQPERLGSKTFHKPDFKPVCPANQILADLRYSA
jgi:hypothetical protein